jgi:hypothetical protein
MSARQVLDGIVQVLIGTWDPPRDLTVKGVVFDEALHPEVLGFSPGTWPLVSFGLEGNRDALSREAEPGDGVVIVGTQEAPTPEDERGRLLGMAEFGRDAVDTADVLDLATLSPEHFDEHWIIKWPKSLPMIRAWRFTGRPLLTETSAAAGI